MGTRIFGRSRDDTLYGTLNSDRIYGRGGDDVIYGGGGNDRLRGDEGNDVLSGGAGYDMLFGDRGDDTLIHGGWEDAFDQLFGGEGFDTLVLNEALDHFTLSRFTSASSIERISAGADANDGFGAMIEGTSWDDTLDFRTVEEMLNIAGIDAGEGADIVWGHADADFILGGGGDDTLYGDDLDLSVGGDDTLLGGDGDDELFGGAGNDTLSGDAGNDALTGGAGDDILDGGVGNDLLKGGAGFDVLLGGVGDDGFVLNTVLDFDDVIVGGDGFDSIVLDSQSVDFQFTRFTQANEIERIAGRSDAEGDAASAILGTDEDDVLDLRGVEVVTNITAIELADGADRVYGHDGEDVILGGAGDDLLLGEGGIDIIFGQEGHDHLFGGDDTDLLNGGSGDDSLYGGDGIDIFAGGPGIDRLAGGAGDDFFFFNAVFDVNDQFLGQDGFDTLVLDADSINFQFTQYKYGISVERIAGKVDSLGNAVSQIEGTDERNWFDFTGVEEFVGIAAISTGDGEDHVHGHQGDDLILGGAAGDFLTGYTGNDRLLGEDGNDTLHGNAGADILEGGTGDDMLRGDLNGRYSFSGEHETAATALGVLRTYYLDGTANEADEETHFDGGGKHVVIPHESGMELDEGTVTLWFNANDVTGERGLFSKDSRSYDDGGHLGLYLNEGQISGRLQSSDSSYYFDGGVVEAGTWHQVTFTWGPEGAKLYQDGVLVDESDYTGGIAENLEPIVLAANAGASGDLTTDHLADFFDGELDGVALVSRALTADEVAVLHSSQKTQIETDGAVSAVDADGPLPLGSVLWTAENGGDNAYLSVYGHVEPENHSGRFNGGTDALVIPHDESLALDNGTISLWINAVNPLREQGILSKDARGQSEPGHLTISVQDGALKVRLQDDNGNSYYIDAGAVEADKWHQITVSWGEEGLRLYQDGTLIGENAYTGGIAGNGEPIVLGASAAGSGAGAANHLGEYFEGDIDGLAIFDRALSAEEIKDFYRLGKHEISRAGDILAEDHIGNDDLVGGNDVLIGGEGKDKLYGDGGDDLLDGGAGNDYLEGGAGDDEIIGGEGTDHASFFGESRDYLFDFEAVDGEITSISVTDTNFLNGDDGTDTVHADVEVLYFAGHYNPTIFGSDTDTADNLTGTWRGEIAVLGAGDDTFVAEGGNDVILGGAGDDDLDGKWGNDIIVGGAGDDTLRGGDGADTFRVGFASDTDTIIDFDADEDEIVLEEGLVIARRDETSDYSADGTNDTLLYLGEDTDGDGVSDRDTGVVIGLTNVTGLTDEDLFL